MANLVLAFGELLIGAVILDAGIKGSSVADVVKGQAKQNPITGLGTSPAAPSGTGAGAGTGTGGGGAGTPLPAGGKTGKISWFNDVTTALGPSAANTPGIAVLDQSTLGGYWLIKLENGREFVTRQIDIGPATWTNRLFDFSAPLQRILGNPATDSTATGVYLGKTVPAKYKSLLIA